MKLDGFEETEWEMGRPPSWIEIDMWIGDHVRRGWIRGETAIFLDCSHPMQNMVVDVDAIKAWRVRDSVRVIPGIGEINAYGNAYMKGGDFGGMVYSLAASAICDGIGLWL
jgi:hypothetical protein